MIDQLTDYRQSMKSNTFTTKSGYNNKINTNANNTTDPKNDNESSSKNREHKVGYDNNRMSDVDLKITTYTGLTR